MCCGKPSHLASSSSVRNRAVMVEKVIETSAANSQDSSEKTKAVNTQRSALMKRDKENFMTCAEEVGLKIFAKFTVEQAASMKREMPWALWRVVKRALCDIAGKDVVGTEKELRTYLDGEHLNFECGSFETSGNKSVTFVRITNIAQVLTALVHSFQSEGQLSCLSNIQSNHLVALIAGDKGSTQTKMVMTVLNATNPHSSKRSKLLAMFERDKDTHECIEKVSKKCSYMYTVLMVSATKHD